MPQNILLTCLNFKGTTGSELYFYDLACGLKKIGYKVSVLSNLKDGFLWEKAHRMGINCYDFSQCPNQKFDIILASHRPVIDQFCKNKLYEEVPIISINHSEIIPLEYPIIDDRIIHYIAIRQSIKDFLENKYFIPSESISLIYNPINTDKILSAKKRVAKKKTVLFAGTVDYLRKDSMLDLCKKANEENLAGIVTQILDVSQLEESEQNPKSNPALTTIEGYVYT